MEQLQYYFKISLVSIKRAPLPYLLTVLILSLGLGMFFACLLYTSDAADE